MCFAWDMTKIFLPQKQRNNFAFLYLSDCLLFSKSLRLLCHNRDRRQAQFLFVKWRCLRTRMCRDILMCLRFWDRFLSNRFPLKRYHPSWKITRCYLSVQQEMLLRRIWMQVFNLAFIWGSANGHVVKYGILHFPANHTAVLKTFLGWLSLMPTGMKGLWSKWCSSWHMINGIKLCQMLLPSNPSYKGYLRTSEGNFLSFIRN